MQLVRNGRLPRAIATALVGGFLGVTGAMMQGVTNHITIPDIMKTLVGAGTKIQNTVIMGIRLPRILVAVFVGAALSTSGCVLQTVTKNELTKPGIIDLNADSALAVILLISSGGALYYEKIQNITIFFMPFVSIAGSLIAGLIIYGLAYKKGKVTATRLILLTIYKSKILDVLDLGDELATGLGVAVEKECRILMVYAVILAAVATSVAGNVAFLGLLGPHIAKKICGPVHARQIPVVAALSGIIIVIADMTSRNAFSPLEIPVGITISIIGVPYFIYLMLKDKNE